MRQGLPGLFGRDSDQENITVPVYDDLSRHDKWLCMMYPRMVLLREFLRPDGIIFVSIDDNEVTNLRLLMDEVFGASNFQQQLVWKNKYGPGAMTKGFGNIHEYILCYSIPIPLAYPRSGRRLAW